jgi:hypothetical protein
MQYLYIGAVVIGLVTDFFKDLFKSKEIKILAIGIAVYFIYGMFRKRELTEKAKNNIVNPENALAVRLFNALHPIFITKIPGIGHLPDGNNKNEVKAAAYEVGQRNNYKKVAEAYTALFKLNLDEELQSEGVFDIFNTEFNRGRSNPGEITVITAPKKTTTAANVNYKGFKLEVGKRYIVTGTFPLRNKDNTVIIEGNTSAGQTYHINGFVEYYVGKQAVKGARVSPVKFGISWGIFTESIISIDALNKLA